MAAGLWLLVFSLRPPQLVTRWLAFLHAHPEVKGIARDTWNMFLNLVEAVPDDDQLLSAYDDDEAWPSLFDDFVDYERERATTQLDETEDAEETNEAEAMMVEHMRS